MSIVTRLGKGSKLTIEEMDNNLLSLETDISVNVSSITSKLDKGAYTGTAKDLDNAITAAVTGASGISITPTSPAPSGTGISSFTATQAGTYTNYGGVVVNANSFAIISRSASGVFSISQTAFDLTTYAKISDVKNDLVSTDVNKPLSANQGKVLNEKFSSTVASLSAQTITWLSGGISQTTGGDIVNAGVKRTAYLSVDGLDYFNYYGIRGYEGNTYSLLSLYDINQVFVVSVWANSTDGAIRQGTVNLKVNYPTVKFIRLSCNGNVGFLNAVTLSFGVNGLKAEIDSVKTSVTNNSTEITNTKTLITNLENNKVNRILQKSKLYTENLVTGANITTSNAKTLTNFYPSVVSSLFNSAIFRSSVPMAMSLGTFPNEFFATPNVPRNLGYTIEFKFTGQYLEIAGRETYYWFTLMVNDVVVVKNFSSATSTAGYDSQGKLWTKVNLGSVVTDANVKLFMGNTFGGVATNGTISLWSANRLKIIADGDSIFEGTGAVVGGSNSSGTNVYSMMGVLSYMLDLDLYDAAVGGSGFITLGNGGQPTMVNRFDAYIAPYPCDIFISGGGLNDGYTTYSQTVEDAVNAYFVKVDALYRKTKTRVVIVSPYEPNGATKAQHLGILGIRDREKVLCLQYGFVFIDMIDGKSFDEMGNLVQDSSTTLGGITDNGRSTIFYFDGTHPNEAGHQYAGKRIMTELYRLLR
jgi:lysophospholipase L1-like esterase